MWLLLLIAWCTRFYCVNMNIIVDIYIIGHQTIPYSSSKQLSRDCWPLWLHIELLMYIVHEPVLQLIYMYM